jgi:hypothetical protein
LVASARHLVKQLRRRRREFFGPVLSLEEISRRYAAWALEQMQGRKMATAEKLDIDRRKTLARLLGGPRED